jgi:hypothetical protein
MYGPCLEPARTDFVNWMKNIQIQDEDNWLFMGDFNFYRSLDNRNKPGGNLQDTFVFNDIISQLGLFEIPIKGCAFTWSNMQVDPLLEQLDWFFSSVHWTCTYPNTLVQPLAKPISDHVPCKVSIGTSIPKSNNFRFENFWPEIEGFFEKVHSAWSPPPRNKRGTAAIIAAKFKSLRYSLKQWSKKISNLKRTIAFCNKVIFFMDCLEDCRPLFPLEVRFRSIIKAQLLQLLRFQNIYWRKRSTLNKIK